MHFDEPRSADVLAIYDRMINTSLYNNTGVELLVFQLYADCEYNLSFYNAFDLESRGYNISQIIDLSSVEHAVGDIKNIELTLPPVQLMSSSFQSILTTLDGELDALAFNEYYTALRNDVVSEDLNDIAEMLDELAVAGEGDVLHEYADVLGNLSVSHVVPAENLRGSLLTQLQVLERYVDINLTAIAINLTAADDTINNSGNVILGVFINTTADDIVAQTVTLAEHIETSVRYDIGTCYPLFSAVSYAIDATCVRSLYPLSGFWYCLGWLLLFLLPSIILAFCLISEFRQTRSYNAFDDDESPYNAFTGSQSAHVLLQPVPPGTSNEFDNPLYAADAGEFKIPRPSVKVEKSDPQTSVAMGNGNDEFKIPRPKLYNEYDKVSPPPSYTSDEEEKNTTINPAAEDTHL